MTATTKRLEMSLLDWRAYCRTELQRMFEKHGAQGVADGAFDDFIYSAITSQLDGSGGAEHVVPLALHMTAHEIVVEKLEAGDMGDVMDFQVFMMTMFIRAGQMIQTMLLRKEGKLR